MKLKISIIIIAVLICQSANLFGEVLSAKISGYVLDKNTKQPLIGANIIVMNSNTGAAADENGFFSIENIKPGSYNLKASYIGYKTLVKSNIIVNPEKTTQIIFELDEDVFKGEGVEVKASYFHKAKEAPISTRSMDFEEVRRAPGAVVDIQRVMQSLPAVVSGSDQMNEIIIRGGMPGENLFIMDNIEIPNPNHFGRQGSGGGPISMLNASLVRNVDFFAGAFPAKYGDKASSVMVISNKTGNKERMTGSAELGMSGIGIAVEGPLYSKGTYVFSARKSYLDMIISSFGLTAVPKYYNIQGKISYELSRQHILSFSTIYGDDAIDIEAEDEDEDSMESHDSNIDSKSQRAALGLNLTSFWMKNLYSVTTLSFVNVDYDTEVKDPETDKLEFWNNSIEREYTLKTDFNYSLSKTLDLNWGASYKVPDFEQDLWSEKDTLFWYNDDGDTEPDSIVQVYNSWSTNETASSYKTAFYGQMSYRFLKHFKTSLGLRYDYFEYNDFSSVSPRLSLTYIFNPVTNLTLGYGKHYQSPSYIELSAHPDNKSLKSKYTEQVVLGLEHLWREDIRMTLELYYKEYKDVPLEYSMTTPDPFDASYGYMINRGEGYSKGFEFFLQKKLIENFSSIVSYSYSISRAKDFRYDEYFNWDYDHRHVLTLIGGYKFRLDDKSWYQESSRKWWFKALSFLPFMPFADEVEVSLKWRYLGGRPYTRPIYHPEYREWIVDENHMYNQTRHDSYHRLDIRIDKRYIYDTWAMVIYFDMMNVYNRDNVWGYDYQDDGDVEEILQFKVFPVVGVSVEF